MQVSETCLDFILRRLAILRRSALDDVTDVHFFARKTNRLQDVREKYTGSADERSSSLIFRGSRAFANDYQSCCGRPFTGYRILPGLAQVTFRTIADESSHALEIERR
jgi:hypothetical protein